jgi:hypothetical protein
MAKLFDGERDADCDPLARFIDDGTPFAPPAMTKDALRQAGYAATPGLWAAALAMYGLTDDDDR